MAPYHRLTGFFAELAMEFDMFQISGVGFPSAKSWELIALHKSLNQYYAQRNYGQEINRIGIRYAIYKPELHKFFPKPRFKKAKMYKATDYAGWPKDWPDRHVPDSLELQTYVDFDTAALAHGSALRHALVDPICESLLLTPKTIQQRIRIHDFIADLKIWADLAS